MLWAGLVLIIGALVVVTLSLASMGRESTGVARSLELINMRPDTRTVARSQLPARDRLLGPLAGSLRGLGRRLSPTGTVERLSRGLDRAGNPTAWSVERIFGAKAACALVGPLLGLLYGGFTAKGLFLAGVLAVALFFLPDVLVYNAGLKRQELLRSGLADALDMLTVCVEAGQGFDAALMQVSRATTGPISGEFARVLAEIQIGRPRGEAFSSMAERTSAPEVRNFVSALVQADRLGLPLGAVLREQSQQMRLVRRQRAEEKAQKVTVKILFPLLFCIFPLLFIVLMGPGILTMIDAFKGF